MKSIMRIPLSVLPLLFLVSSCTPVEPEPDTNPFLIFKTGSGFLTNGTAIAPGGTLKFGISGTGGGAAITNLVVKRIADGVTTTLTDKGMWKPVGGIDTTLVFARGYAEVERWIFFIMNAYRDTASISMTILKGTGSAWGEINYYHSVTLGMQSNAIYPHYLDLTTGLAYDQSSVTGNESVIDMAVFYYLSSGKSSPTLTCPYYNSAITYYPEFEDWPIRNQTLYDYYSSDYDLVSASEFDRAENDSLLVSAYRSQSVSGQSKFAYTGKIVPFRTSDGKYGMLKVIRADEQTDGSMELAIKIQK